MLTGGERHLRFTAGGAMVVALLTVSCGGGDTAPATPPAATAPLPVPPSPATPVLRAKVSVFSAPSYSAGYTEGDWIRLVAEFEQGVRVERSPRLAIKIGDAIRHAAFSPWVAERRSGHQPPFQQRFDYLVQADDLDEDGISIGLDAFDFTEGVLLNEAGAVVGVEIYSVTPAESDRILEPGMDLDPHPVVGRPRPRVCSDERELALARQPPPVLIEEWDGAPFLFYFSLMDLSERDRHEAEHTLNIVERLSERIEDQLGYSVIEVGGWMQDARLRFADSWCEFRTPGQIVGMVVPESAAEYVGPGGYAKPRCALWGSMGYLGITEDLGGADGTVSHEIFHLLGFSHHPTDWQRPGRPGDGVPMSVRLNGAYVDSTDLGISFADVDALRCIFPKQG